MDSLEHILQSFVEQSQTILRENLVGVYLHGSAVMGCFNPEKSDIDLIVVVENAMTVSEKRAFMDMVIALNTAAPPKGIEMSVVRKEFCKPFLYPTPFELHFSPMHLAAYRNDPDGYVQRPHGGDIDLAAHFTVIGKRGKCLAGKPISEVFAPVPRENYIDSIWQDVAAAKEDILENPLYIILNLTRVLAYLREETVLSKKEGGEWALTHLPETYHSLIETALHEYAEGTEPAYDTKAAVQYAGYMLCEIENAM